MPVSSPSALHPVQNWLPPVVAGFLAVLISCSGPLLLVIQAAHLAHLSSAHIASWIAAICFGSGVVGAYLSWRLRVPIICAWNTPGAALLVASLALYPWAQAVGAFVVAAVIVWLVGLSGAFERLVRLFPQSLCAALLAGILLRFGMQAFTALQDEAALVLPVLIVYVLCRRWWPRYAVLFALMAGALAWLAMQAAGTGQVPHDTSAAAGLVVQPVFTWPQWDQQAIISLGLPLALLNLTGQQLPGVAVLRAAGFEPHASKAVTHTGFWSVLLAPFGAHGINLAAITAALCTGPEAHPVPEQRWRAGVACGVFYVLVALFAGHFASWLLALPKSVVAAVAGVALLGAIQNGLASSMQNPHEREAALITFLVTASGVVLWGLGAGFWGLVLGGLAWLVLCYGKKA